MRSRLNGHRARQRCWKPTLLGALGHSIPSFALAYVRARALSATISDAPTQTTIHESRRRRRPSSCELHGARENEGEPARDDFTRGVLVRAVRQADAAGRIRFDFAAEASRRRNRYQIQVATTDADRATRNFSVLAHSAERCGHAADRRPAAPASHHVDRYPLRPSATADFRASAARASPRLNGNP